MLRLLLPLVLLAGALPLHAQQLTTDAAPIQLTLEEAVEVALVRNYALRSQRLDVDLADAQVREAYSAVMPNVNLTSSYTRTVKAADPFAGSDAGGLFGSLGFVNWLAYNERARTDDSPVTSPISFMAYQDSVSAGFERSGVVVEQNDNAFLVPNRFDNSISIEQTLFNGSAFAAIRGAQRLRDVNARGVDRQEQVLAQQVAEQYFDALLAQEQVRVQRQSVERAGDTVEETIRRVARGAAPKFQRLTAEVNRTNLQSQLVRAQTLAATALDQLKLTLGISPTQPITLVGELTVPARLDLAGLTVDDALVTALERRPDVSQAQLGIELREINADITRAAFLPTLSAFATLGYTGTVPDNRTSVISDPDRPDDPFAVTERTNGFFSDSYWQPNVNVGARLTWNIFNGFATSAQLQQRRIETERARIDLERLLDGIRFEVSVALRNAQAAQLQILSQERNVEQAEVNYQFADARLDEGVATPLEVREASDLLDQSRLNYLQAIRDYRTAIATLEVAIGTPLLDGSPLRVATAVSDALDAPLPAAGSAR
jgi:outer membrane protein TolC